MKNTHRFLNIKYITIFGIIAMLIIVSIIMITGTTKANEESEPLMLSKDMLPNLLIAPEELPWDLVLSDFEVITNQRSGMFISSIKGPKLEARWSGLPTSKNIEEMKTPEYSVSIGIALVDSPDDAAYLTEKQANSYSAIIKEVINDEVISKITDRAWGFSSIDMAPTLGASLFFTRGPVIVNAVMHHKETFDPQLFINLLMCISRKIDAALAGKPEPVPIMPLAADYGLGGNVNSAFKMRTLGSRLWGKESKNIALCDENGIPRLIPAKQTADGDYLVSLRHLVAIIGIGSITSASTKKDIDLGVYGAELNHMGNLLVFTINSSEMKAGEKTIQLNHPVEFRENEIIVPLNSVVQEGLGKKISWEKRGEMMIGKIN